MNATKLLRDEFFTIFGDLDTKTVQQGRGFEAKVFQQVYQRLTNAVGGTQHPTDGGEGKLGWSLEEALSQLHDAWPRCPHLHCLVSWCCSSRPRYLLAPCRHLRDLSVSCTAPETYGWATESPPQTLYTRMTKGPGLIQPFVYSVDFNDFQRSRKGKCSLTCILLLGH